MVRRNAETDKWHPTTDDGVGTADPYGVTRTNPLGTETFSFKYSDFHFSKIMFAWGNKEQWIIYEKTAFEAIISRNDLEMSEDSSELKKSNPTEPAKLWMT